MKKEILYFQKNVIVSCDEKCFKAWGISNRPYKTLSDDPDDIMYLADGELSNAPVDPGTAEGGHIKPVDLNNKPLKSIIPNKWCVRECERCFINSKGSDYSIRVFNIPSSNVGSEKTDNVIVSKLDRWQI